MYRKVSNGSMSHLAALQGIERLFIMEKFDVSLQRPFRKNLIFATVALSTVCDSTALKETLDTFGLACICNL